MPSRKEKRSEIGEAFPYWRTLDKGGEVRAVSQKLQMLTANSCQLTKPLFFCLKEKKELNFTHLTMASWHFLPSRKSVENVRLSQHHFFNQMGDEPAHELSKPFFRFNSFLLLHHLQMSACLSCNMDKLQTGSKTYAEM